MTATLDKAVISSLLSERIGQLAIELLGARTIPLSSRTDWRRRAKGSLCVVVSGAKIGWWFDHEAGAGGDALALIQRERRCSFPGALAWAAEWLGSVAIEQPTSTPARQASAPDDRQSRTACALRIWAGADDPPGTLVERYLESRGLALPDDAFEVLRFHRRLQCGERRSAGMVALLRDLATDKPCGIHRTFLAQDGSRLGKRMLGRVRGAAIKLCADDEVTTGLGVAEGIETASIMSTGWRPIWVLGSANAIRRLPVLSGVDALTIFADHDETGVGEAAADTCAAAWSNAGREVTIAVPNVPGDDFNDCLIGLRRAS
jgi:putative DNA primase/helicase